MANYYLIPEYAQSTLRQDEKNQAKKPGLLKKVFSSPSESALEKGPIAVETPQDAIDAELAVDKAIGFVLYQENEAGDDKALVHMMIGDDIVLFPPDETGYRKERARAANAPVLVACLVGEGVDYSPFVSIDENGVGVKVIGRDGKNMTPTDEEIQQATRNLEMFVASQSRGRRRRL